MRLIDTRQLKFKEFLGSDIPEYAILSHCWGDDEVSYHDFLAGRKQDGLGYKKITDCCALALEQGLSWAWVDTCCIDKSSSAELSEAINSMRAWYERSTICFAFLPEEIVSRQVWSVEEPTWFHYCHTTGYQGTFVSTPEETFSTPFCNACFSKSRWFTRGWTLQELLAPKDVLFLDRNLAKIGPMGLLAYEIAKITGIDRQYLVNHKAFHRASVACRMSWASSRQTTRVEDIAYCLLGLFDINMPLLYGEGNKAFLRLQQYIFESIPDDSLLAWTAIRSSRLQGIFAQHPSDFANSKHIVPVPRMLSVPPNRLTSVGLELYFPVPWHHLPIHRRSHELVKEMTVPLACRRQDAENANREVVVIKLSNSQALQPNLFLRVNAGKHHTEPDMRNRFLSKVVLVRFDKLYVHSGSTTIVPPRSFDEDGWDHFLLMTNNSVCMMIPIVLALCEAAHLFDDLSASQKTAGIWLVLTLGSLGATAKLYYSFAVLVAIAIMPDVGLAQFVTVIFSCWVGARLFMRNPSLVASGQEALGE
ncbi:hypothetical protein PRZ48_013428 [Zasmidium cellare]|uniref:Heterokaryon incompatibility domain-containing protein n=1 Tax=Zasmidium cellare TaxID=395010 RepID=A0ABR0E1M9_ZASCE|nr:hypothetical protein PRZ48_013428 [Zasmidium cellare]